MNENVKNDKCSETGQQGTCCHLELPYITRAATDHSISVTFHKRPTINNVNIMTNSCKCRAIDRWQ